MIQHRDHNNILRTQCYIAMSLANSTLYEVILEGNTDRETIIGFLQDTTRGLSFLAARRIVHRDIKPENILIFLRKLS